MLENRGKSFLRFSMTFLCVLLCSFGYLTTVQSKSISSIATLKEEKAVVENQLEEGSIIGFEVPVMVEKKEEIQVSQTTSRTESVPVVVESVGDHIAIDHVLYKNLMKDVNADHFYLNHNINGVYDGLGVPYIDFRNDFSGRKTIIYAHSTLAGNGPFQVLQNYHYNPNYFANHRMIQVTYQGISYQYCIG